MSLKCEYCQEKRHHYHFFISDMQLMPQCFDNECSCCESHLSASGVIHRKCMDPQCSMSFELKMEDSSKLENAFCGKCNQDDDKFNAYVTDLMDLNITIKKTLWMVSCPTSKIQIWIRIPVMCYSEQIHTEPIHEEKKDETE